MKEKEFEKELERRLQENRWLGEHQLLPHKAFGVAAFVGSHMFWVFLITAFGLALITVTQFAEQLKWAHTVMLFLP